MKFIPRFLIAALLFSSASLSAQDSTPQLVSRTAGGVQWKNIAELKTAAAAGNPEACAQLGEQLLRGDRVPKDGPQAITLLEQAARAGVPSAAFRIGMLLDDGNEVAQDRARALDYFRAAAAGDVAEAYHNIGAAYAGAHGVKRDYVEALGWLILATKHGVGRDSEKSLRDRILKLKHPEWIADGEKRVGELERELAAKKVPDFLPPPQSLTYTGSSDAAPAAAGANTNDRGVVKLGPVTVTNSSTVDSPAGNTKEIKLVSPTGHFRRWPSLDALQGAADSGDPIALAGLGQLLVEGNLIKPDVDRAVPLLERAARAGSIDAAQQLGALYSSNAKIPADSAKAFQYNLQAARGGSAQGMHNAGAQLSNGLGTTRNFTEGLAWLILAKQNGRDTGAEKSIRAYLTKSAPDQIPVAEKRAAELQREIEANKDQVH